MTGFWGRAVTIGYLGKVGMTPSMAARGPTSAMGARMAVGGQRFQLRDGKQCAVTASAVWVDPERTTRA
jgi:hypothetical protein